MTDRYFAELKEWQRAAYAESVVFIIEVSGINGVFPGFLPTRLGFRKVIERAMIFVCSAFRDSVHACSDEIALANVIRRDIYLNRLDCVKRNWRDSGAVSRLSGKAEGIVEVDPSTVMLFSGCLVQRMIRRHLLGA